MKFPSLSVALLMLIFFGIKPLSANKIGTPFGSMPDRFQYVKSAENGENNVQHTATVTQEANGDNEQQIRVSVDGSRPITVSPAVVRYLSSLEMNDQTKVNIFIALIIIQYEKGDYRPLSNIDADATDGTNIQSETVFYGGRYSFNIPSRNSENTYSLAANVPTDSNVMANSWHLYITNPEQMQFTISMPPEPSPVDEECTTQDKESGSNGCCSGLFGMCRRHFSSY